jgi:hypothetical protein
MKPRLQEEAVKPFFLEGYSKLAQSLAGYRSCTRQINDPVIGSGEERLIQAGSDSISGKPNTCFQLH